MTLYGSVGEQQLARAPMATVQSSRITCGWQGEAARLPHSLITPLVLRFLPLSLFYFFLYIQYTRKKNNNTPLYNVVRLPVA